HRLGLADRAYQPLGTTDAGHDADADFRLGKTGAAPGNDDVGMHRQFTAAAVGIAAYRGDHRLGAVLNGCPGALGMPLVDIDGANPGHAGDIATGGEYLVAAGEDDAADLRVGGQLGEMLGKQSLQLKAEGVGHRWAVQGES